MISIIVTTYNRADRISRAIDSILAQDYKDLEIIVVDDGSTDNTKEILGLYNDDRIRIITHPINKGVCAAKNSGLDNIRGEWFTFSDSDDEMVVPNALSTMLNVPKTIDPEINAVSSNSIDSSTWKYMGFGMDKDGYIDTKTYMRDLSGDHWGITKTVLLGNDRFNENISGAEDLLWYKIQKRSKRYYIHQGLRIYHTESTDSIVKTSRVFPIERRCKEFNEILNETEYIQDLKIYAIEKYKALLFRAILIYIEASDKAKARFLNSEYKTLPNTFYRRIIILLMMILGKNLIPIAKQIKRKFSAR